MVEIDPASLPELSQPSRASKNFRNTKMYKMCVCMFFMTRVKSI